jgi:hypothetical protein
MIREKGRLVLTKQGYYTFIPTFGESILRKEVGEYLSMQIYLRKMLIRICGIPKELLNGK